jgi:hypothetical protein
MFKYIMSIINNMKYRESLVVLPFLLMELKNYFYILNYIPVILIISLKI